MQSLNRTLLGKTMNKNKNEFLLSLAIGLSGGIGLLSISKLSGENISVFFQNTEGLYSQEQ